MELLHYDEATGDYTLKMSQREFLEVMDIVGGVSSTPDLQDFTVLGATQQRVAALAEQLRNVLTDNLKKRGLHRQV